MNMDEIVRRETKMKMVIGGNSVNCPLSPSAALVCCLWGSRYFTMSCRAKYRAHLHNGIAASVGLSEGGKLEQKLITTIL